MDQLVLTKPSLVAVPEGKDDDAVFIDNLTVTLSDTVQNMLGEEMFSKETKEFLKPNFNETTKILGVGYCKDKDVLFVRIPDQTEKEVNTMTDILSIVSAYYDPLGISQPYCLEGRAIFQHCNRLRLGWKDKLPEDVRKRFMKWLGHREGLRQIQVPRWSSSWELVESKVDLVVYVDASKDAFGSCVYFRRYLPDESVIMTRLMLGKGRVVPLSMHIDKNEDEEDHNNSMPRLELTAARLGAELCSLMQRMSEETFENIYLFSDSTCVLDWIADLDKKFRTFEHFRLKKIWTLTNDSWWSYCPTDSNPADVLTHFLSTRPRDLPRWTLYLEGPPWLRLPKRHWPKKPNVVTKEEEINALYMALDFSPSELFPERLRPKQEGHLSSTSNCAGSTTASPGAFLNDFVLTEADAYQLLPESAQISNDSNSTSPDLDPSLCNLLPSTVMSLAPVRADVLRVGHNDVRSDNFVLDLVAKTSDWGEKLEKIGRVTKWLSHLRSFLRAGRQNVLGPISMRRYLAKNEREQAERDLLFAIQTKHFETERLDLVAQGAFGPNSHKVLRNKKSRLTSTNPFICTDFLVRVGSRIQNATVSFDQKFPILLPPKCEHVRSLVRHEHVLLGHSLNQHLFAHLRKKFYILGGKSTITSIIKECVDCQRHDKKPSNQLMGVLPESRVNIVRPFRVTGLDMIGPMKVKHGGRGHAKRWILLLTCTATRAVMLFPLHNITTQAFLIAMSKFQALYPGLEQIICDNGTNFRGGETLTNALHDNFNLERVEGELALKNVKFSFNSPDSPHMGGFFERLVKSVKRILSFIMPSSELHYEAFDAALFRCAHILNSRPLQPCGSGINDLIPLCPQNFLTPYLYDPAITLDPPVTFSSADLKGSWGEMRKLVNEFLVRWGGEYLTQLGNRPKWKNYQTPFYDGQVVIVVDSHAPRTHWNLGVVTGALPSDDGIPKRYLVRISSGKIIEKHHNRLVPLELEGERDD